MADIPIPSKEQVDYITIIVGWVWKIGAVFLSFVGGVISAAWVLRGYADRLTKVEEFQKQCAGDTIKKIDANIDWIVKTGLREVHERIDAIKDK